MKKKNLLFMAIIISVIAVTLVVSCKKENENVSTNAQTNTEAKVLLDRIRSFQKLCDAVNSNMKAEGSMTVKEMRDIIDLTANFEHSEHMTYCKNTTLDTLHIAMPFVDNNGNVAETDVVATYNAFENALQKCMEAIDDEMDVPSLFSIMLPQVGAKDNDSINIIFTRGEGTDSISPMVVGPIEDLCLVWGMDGGYCNPTPQVNIIWDAADELSTYFTANVTSPGNGWYQIFFETEYVEYVATNTFMVYNPYFPNWTYWVPQTQISPCGDWLFHYSGIISSGDEPCLCEDDMNCEWYNITYFIVTQTGGLHYSPYYGSPYYSCEVKDYTLVYKPTGEICDRIHTARVLYTNYYWTHIVD